MVVVNKLTIIKVDTAYKDYLGGTSSLYSVLKYSKLKYCFYK